MVFKQKFTILVLSNKSTYQRTAKFRITNERNNKLISDVILILKKLFPDAINKIVVLNNIPIK